MRVKALQRLLTERGDGAALITSPENIRYFTGFYTWNGHVPFALALVPAQGEPVLLVPRADDHLASAVARCALEPYDPGTGGFRTTAEVCRGALARAGIAGGSLALEFAAVPLDRARVLETVLAPYRFTDATAALSDLRLIKDPEEQQRLRAGAALVAAGVARAVARTEPGVSELEIKAAVEFAVHTEGARRWPDAIIQSHTNVVSGRKLNRLHDGATGHTAGPGEIFFALGDVSVDGYRANIGRTWFVPGRTPPEDAQRALSTADAAHAAAVSRLRPGGLLRESIPAADAVLLEAGLAGQRTYPLIRGLGLRVDERPKAAEAGDLDLPLSPGMCMCVQLYIRQPARIVGRSDSVLITEAGADVITGPRGGS